MARSGAATWPATASSDIEIELVDGILVLAPPAVSTRIEQRDGRPTIVADEDLPPLRDDVVRAVRDDVRR